MSNLLLVMVCLSAWLADFWLLADLGNNGGLL
jgi:hypothetical protein